LIVQKDGYIHISVDGENQYIHRLVADQFLKRVDGKNEVDHIDHDRNNNKLSNLRWVDRSENNENKIANSLPLNNINLTKSGTYRVRNRSNIRKTFKTIEEAILFRDSN
ncbi:MAG: HNH endonuclease signature motif containing protein, partial [Nanoarchaeota archaeon]